MPFAGCQAADGRPERQATVAVIADHPQPRQHGIGPRGRGVVGGPDLVDQAGTQRVQLAQHGVDRGHRVGGGPPGVRVRLMAGLPDREPNAQAVHVAADRGQRAVICVLAGVC